MVPFYDMYNHRNGWYHNTVVEAWHKEGFVVRTSRAIGAHEQLYNSYGFGAPDIFNDYGFIEQPRSQWYFFDPVSPHTRHDFELVEAAGGVKAKLSDGAVPSDFTAAARRALMRALSTVPSASTAARVANLLSDQPEGAPEPEDVKAAWAYRTAYEGALRRAIQQTEGLPSVDREL